MYARAGLLLKPLIEHLEYCLNTGFLSFYTMP